MRSIQKTGKEFLEKKNMKKVNWKRRTGKVEQITLNDDFSFVSEKDGKTYSLTTKERLFAEKYLEFYGNGTKAALESGYDVKNAMIAGAVAYENLRKPQIISYIDSLMEKYGFNEENTTKQHLFLLNQFADLKTKAKAIDMMYRLKGKYAPEKIQHEIINEEDVEQRIKNLQSADKRD